MTILLIAPRIPYPLTDGYSRAVYHPLRYLAGKGHKVILCYLADPSDQGQEAELTRLCQVVAFPASTARTAAGMLGSLFSAQSYYLSRFHNDDLQKEILRLIANERPDVIQLEQLHCAFYGIGIKGRFDIPVLLRLHNVESSLVERFARQAGNPFARLYALLETAKIRKYERDVSPLFDRLLTISDEDDHQIRTIQPAARSTVVPTGVDTDFFSPREEPTRSDSILLLAAFHWRPNQDSFWWFVDDVLPLILQKKPHARLFVVGMNPTKEMLSVRHRNVEIVGAVDDVREHIARHSVAVVPLRIGGGVRLKLLELFAMGKAVVTTPIGCEGIHGTDHIHVRIEESAKGFAEAVVGLLDDRAQRARIGKAARDLVVQHYSWDAILPSYEQLCLTMVTDRRIGS